MNTHHLELFYYVARHGGIGEAVRNMPYGIQQPAMSSQVIQLEEDLGLTLFQRRPFQLTPAGEELFAFIKPFFDNVESVGEKLRHLRKQFPELKVTLRNGYLPELEGLLQRQEIDFAVTLLEGKLPAGTNGVPLLKLPLGLLVPAASRIQSAEELWKRDRIDETLISLPEAEPIARHFQSGLARLGVDWFPRIEVSSLDVLEAYVANGYGIGLTVIVPKSTLRPGARLLPLPEFPPITLGALWRGKLTPITQAFLNELQARAKLLTA